MAAQGLARLVTSSSSNTCSSRPTWPFVSSRWLVNAAFSCGCAAALAILGSAFTSCFSA